MGSASANRPSENGDKRYLGLYPSILPLFRDLPANVEVITLPAEDEEVNPDELGRIQFLPLPFELRRRIHDFLPHLNNLQVLQTFSAGLDHTIPLVPPGVTLCSARGAHDTAVSEWVLAVLLSSYRQLPNFYTRQLDGKWDRATNDLVNEKVPSVGRLQQIKGKRILIVGHGSIGRAVAERLTGFGVDIVGVARRPRPGVLGLAALDDELPLADVIVLLAPLLPETRHLVDASFIAKTRPGVLIINAGRGPLINSADLEAALRAGRVQAALDVTDPEPLPPNHSLWTAPNLIITPHVAGAVEGWRIPAQELITEQIKRWASNQPLLNVAIDGY